MTGKVAQESLKKNGEPLLARSLARLAADEERHLAEMGLHPAAFMENMLLHLSAHSAGEKADASPLVIAVEEFARRHEHPWEWVKKLVRAFFEAVGEDLAAEGEGGEGSAVELGIAQRDLELALCETCLRVETEKKRELVENLRTIDRFPDTIASTLDPLTLSKVALGRLKHLMGAEKSALYEVDSRGNLVPVTGDDAVTGAGSLQVPDGAAKALLERGESVLLEGFPTLGEISSAGEGRGDILLLPLVIRGRTTGAVLLARAPSSPVFTREGVEIAERFANRLAVALENARLHAREQRKIKETVALLEITRAINSTLDLENILHKVVRMSIDLCPAVMCAIYLVEDGRCRIGAWYGFIEESLWREERERGFRLDELGEEDLASLLAGMPVNIPSQGARFLLSPEVLREHGVDVILLYPLKARERLSGMMALLLPPRESRGLEKEEMEVVAAIASQATMAIENASLYEDIERSYFSTVQALAKAIEVKDPYTHGHSERVTAYALMIAEAMRLDEREKQKLKYAATLHDIGKIGIAGRVLNKPGALTDEEYSHVKTHPALGDSIVEPVEFLQGPRPIILHHHERYDGRGYPHGLKGEDIPMCARILSVADAFEAMRSDRPYRKALPFEEARQELIRNAGTQFDPEVVEIFLDILDRSKGDPIKR